MNIRLDPVDLSVGADRFEARAESMASQRAEIETSVDALLGAWQGEAATRFAELWEQWRTGADEVISGLSMSAAALRSTRDDLADADVQVGERHEHLARRLG